MPHCLGQLCDPEGLCRQHVCPRRDAEEKAGLVASMLFTTCQESPLRRSDSSLESLVGVSLSKDRDCDAQH